MNYKKYLLIGIPVLFLVGCLFHYLYEWSGNNVLIGFISPTNESIWEHLKTVLLPMTSYWAIYLLINPNIQKNKWFFSLFISLISAMLAIICFYYTYTGALGIESLALDIFSLFLGITIGHLLGNHFYTYSSDIPSFISISLLVIIFITFFIFTILPPALPIFQTN